MATVKQQPATVQVHWTVEMEVRLIDMWQIMTACVVRLPRYIITVWTKRRAEDLHLCFECTR